MVENLRSSETKESTASAETAHPTIPGYIESLEKAVTALTPELMHNIREQGDLLLLRAQILKLDAEDGVEALKHRFDALTKKVLDLKVTAKTETANMLDEIAEKCMVLSESLAEPKANAAMKR